MSNLIYDGLYLKNKLRFEWSFHQLFPMVAGETSSFTLGFLNQIGDGFVMGQETSYGNQSSFFFKQRFDGDDYPLMHFDLAKGGLEFDHQTHVPLEPLFDSSIPSRKYVDDAITDRAGIVKDVTMTIPEEDSPWLSIGKDFNLETLKIDFKLHLSQLLQNVNNLHSGGIVFKSATNAILPDFFTTISDPISPNDEILSIDQDGFYKWTPLSDLGLVDIQTETDAILIQRPPQTSKGIIKVNLTALLQSLNDISGKGVIYKDTSTYRSIDSSSAGRLFVSTTTAPLWMEILASDGLSITSHTDTAKLSFDLNDELQGLSRLLNANGMIYRSGDAAYSIFSFGSPGGRILGRDDEDLPVWLSLSGDNIIRVGTGLSISPPTDDPHAVKIDLSESLQNLNALSSQGPLIKTGTNSYDSLSPAGSSDGAILSYKGSAHNYSWRQLVCQYPLSMALTAGSYNLSVGSELAALSQIEQIDGYIYRVGTLNDDNGVDYSVMSLGAAGGRFLGRTTGGLPSWLSAVTSIGITPPIDGSITVTGSPVIDSGSISLDLGSNLKNIHALSGTGMIRKQTSGITLLPDTGTSFGDVLLHGAADTQWWFKWIPSTGLTITPVLTGVTGEIRFNLSNELQALSELSSEGILWRNNSGAYSAFPIATSGGGGFLSRNASNQLVWSNPVGAGDVTGDTSSEDTQVAVFSGTSGKSIKTTPVKIDAAGRMSGLDTPLLGSDAATKDFVLSQRFSRIERITASGSWIIPSGVTCVKITLLGAGAGGATPYWLANSSFGGSGNAGNTLILYIAGLDKALGSSIDFTIGLGGLAATTIATNGQDGGDSSCSITDLNNQLLSFIARGGRGGVFPNGNYKTSSVSNLSTIGNGYSGSLFVVKTALFIGEKGHYAYHYPGGALSYFHHAFPGAESFLGRSGYPGIVNMGGASFENAQGEAPQPNTGCGGAGGANAQQSNGTGRVNPLPGASGLAMIEY